ncbi:MAG: Gfo/Idh/MocA family oxidoreductase [Gammaproteobacteria bacterium]|nr:Gfo/Idh/MocA family oxidoreductase [Gammaproteobacteria bacterium]
MKTIKCAVIGTGYLGQFHAEKYYQLDNAQLIAIVDNDQQQATAIAKKFHAQPLTDYQSLTNIDAVSIATPTQTHFTIAKHFLQQGVHVLVEKPMTTTVEEANQLIQLAQQNHCLLQVGHLERFNSAIIALDGVLNSPRFIESHRIAPFTPRGTDVSVVLDLMIHDIDLIHSMVCSPITQIMANGAPVLTEHIDIANVRLQFANGCVANVTASRAGLKTERRMRIFQHDAYISLNLHEKRFSVYRKGSGEMFPGIPNVKHKKHKFPKSDAIKAEIAAFLDAIIHDKPVVVSGEDGRNALQTALDITDTIYQSIETYYAT